jgi:very-short-patch-repair endonuclease
VRDVLIRAGLPVPVQQHRVRVNGRTYLLDYAYPEHRVFIEFYGVAWHGTPSAVVYDSARLSDLTSHGWQPLIFTEATPDGVIVDRTRAILAAAGPVGSLTTRSA